MVLLLLVVVLISLVADFLLPFYYLLISSSRLFTVLTASMNPILNQKPTIPIPIKDSIAPGPPDLLEVNGPTEPGVAVRPHKVLFISTGLGACGAFIVSTCSSIFITLRQIMPARNYSNAQGS